MFLAKRKQIRSFRQARGADGEAGTLVVIVHDFFDSSILTLLASSPSRFHIMAHIRSTPRPLGCRAIRTPRRTFVTTRVVFRQYSPPLPPSQGQAVAQHVCVTTGWPWAVVQKTRWGQVENPMSGAQGEVISIQVWRQVGEWRVWTRHIVGVVAGVVYIMMGCDEMMIPMILL